ncbi:Hemolysin-type calcium-binding region, partial [Candidatus Magnetomorum sp. HK-1]
MNLFANQIGKLLLSFILIYSLMITPGNAGIPEPETIIYGKIINNYEGYDMLVTKGTLDWQIVDVNADKYSYSAQLDKKDNGYSYVLSIPKETAASIILHSGTYLFNENDFLIISDQAKKLKHSEIIVNGYKAQIIAPASNSLSIDQETRLDTFRVDLKINYEPPDTDKDGIPDFWEEKNNLNIDSSVDAALDSDEDGWTNIDEFKMGSNPNMSNIKPSISDDQSSIRIPEGARTILNIMVLDSDSKAEDILIKLI